MREGAGAVASAPSSKAATPGAYRWINEASALLRAWYQTKNTDNAEEFNKRLQATDSLLSGVPCEPGDLGFNSPADRYARAWHALRPAPPRKNPGCNTTPQDCVAADCERTGICQWPQNDSATQPFCWYRVTLDITDEYETVYSEDGERPQGDGWKPLYDAPQSESGTPDTTKADALLERIHDDLVARAKLNDEDAVELSSGLWSDLCGYLQTIPPSLSGVEEGG